MVILHFNRFYLAVKPPSQQPLFSERHDYRRPLLSLKGFRVFTGRWPR